jgi:DNA-binding MarR family transcriptional regulator
MAQIDNASFSVDGDKGRLQDLARHILDERDRRQWYFPRVFFDEAPWQLLLVLYVSDTRRLSSEALENSILQSRSAISRWIDYLETEALITRRAEPSDKSRSMVELTPLALRLLDLYLSDRIQRTVQKNETADRAAQLARSKLSVGLVVLLLAILTAGIIHILTAH